MTSFLCSPKSLSLRPPVPSVPSFSSYLPRRSVACKATMSPDSVHVPEGYDRNKEVKEFDDSKIGVKGIVDAGATAIPAFFIHPPADLPTPCTNPSSGLEMEIPVVDLNGRSDPARRQEIVNQISEASRTWGFFQATNHGISEENMDDTIAAVRRFNELPTEEKSRYYVRTMETGVAFATNFDLFKTKAASWRDTLQVRLGPVPVNPDDIPAECREEIVRWGELADGLASELGQMLCAGLGVDANRLEENGSIEGKQLVAHYYPWCPQPDLTWGLTGHADPGVLTVLLQDHVGGLQVKHADCWVDARPIPGAIVINVGDLLQMISNGTYKSVEHRVVANRSHEARVSIAIFYTPGRRDENSYYGPLPELISPETPALYRQFTFMEFLTKFVNKGLDGKSMLDFFKV